MNFALYVGLSADKNFGDWWLYEIIRNELNPLRVIAFDRILPHNRLRRMACHLWSAGIIPRCSCTLLGGGTILRPIKGYLRQPLFYASKKRYTIGTGARSVQEMSVFKKLLTKEKCHLRADIYSEFERLTVRGPLSLESLRSAGVERDIEIVGDPFLGLFAPDQTVKKDNAKNVVLNVADLDESQGHYWPPRGATVAEAYGLLISSLSLAGYSTRLVVCAPVDLPFAVRLAQRHALPAPTVALTIAQFDELLRNCGRVIATRLHFMIYSILRGVPTASLNYQDKHLDFWQSILPKKNCLRFSEFKMSNLLEECERGWSEFTIQWDQCRSQIICLNKRRDALYHEIRASLHNS